MKHAEFYFQLLLALPGWAFYTVAMAGTWPLGLLHLAHGWYAWLPGPLLIGVPLVAVQALLGRYNAMLHQPHPLLWWRDRWMWLWGNLEDGIDGSANGFWPPQPAHSWAEKSQIIAWSAWRNSVGNGRRTRLYGMTVDPPKVRIQYLGAGPFLNLKEGPYLAQQGWRYEVKFCWNPKQPDWKKRRYFWFGWRIAQQTEVTTGVGFACQPCMSLA